VEEKEAQIPMKDILVFTILSQRTDGTYS